jgi:hypothetical protein
MSVGGVGRPEPVSTCGFRLAALVMISKLLVTLAPLLDCELLALAPAEADDANAIRLAE